jgi:hypothetical protein
MRTILAAALGALALGTVAAEEPRAPGGDAPAAAPAKPAAGAAAAPATPVPAAAAAPVPAPPTPAKGDAPRPKGSKPLLAPVKGDAKPAAPGGKAQPCEEVRPCAIP